MSSPILTTKLYIPQPRANLVHRRRLIEQLESGLDGRLTLLSAPPGFGKTTLLSDWIASENHPTAWISLDGDDNDLNRFISYLLCALDTIGVEIDDSRLDTLSGDESGRTKLALTAMINELREITRSLTGVQRPMLIVLDDYQVITNRSVNEAVAYLVENLPPTVHVVITSRDDPILPLHRLRIRGDLNELRAADLRFSSEEIKSFFQSTLDISLSSQERSALAARTEGWAAGLQVAALSLRGREDATTFIQTFTGSNRYILDFLQEEVLANQPENVQKFLLQTSILERLYSPLCEAITGQSDAQLTLETLDRSNLFLIHLDDEGHWFRYHLLFATFLQSQLQRTQPDQVQELHRRASRWLCENHLPLEAINHALIAEDYEFAGELIAGTARDMVFQGEWATLGRWLDAIPGEFINSRPRLCLAQAWALLYTTQGDQVEAYLGKTDTLLSEGYVPGTQIEHWDEYLATIHGEINAIRAILASNLGDTGVTITLGQQALAHLPQEDIHLRTAIVLAMGYAYRYQGEVRNALNVFNQAISLSQETGNQHQVVDGLCNVSNLQLTAGQLQNASTTINRAIDILESGRSVIGGIAGVAYLIDAVIGYELNELHRAEENIHRGIDLCAGQNLIELIYGGYLWQAEIYRTQKRYQEAKESIITARRYAHETHNPRVIAHANAFRARLSLYMGDLESAKRWGESLVPGRLERSTALPIMLEFEDLTLIQLYLALGDPNRTLSIIDTDLPRALAADRLYHGYKMTAFQAVAQNAGGDAPGAQITLSKLLSLTEAEGFIRLYVDAGQPMAEMLRQAASHGISPNYVERILAAYDQDEHAEDISPALDQAAPWELLTTREGEVLQLIAVGYSNKEIANELVITVGTVKRHLSSIYNKLDVANRTQAAVRAREIRLIN